MKKWIITIVVLVIVIGGGSWYYINSKKSQQPIMAAASTATVQKGNLDVKINGSGSVASSSSIDVESDVMGEVDEVLVSKNDTVSKGDELINFTDGSDPITAPNSGTITSLDIESGEKVTVKQVVAHITNYNKLETTINIDELDISDIKVGQSAEITASAFPDETFIGKVASVSREGESTNGVSTFAVTVSINEPKKLKVGMSTEANILTASKKNILYIPVEAVRTNGNQKFVLVPASSDQQNSSSRVEIETGIHNDSYIEVLNGLQQGQTIELPAVAKSSSTNQNNWGGRVNGMNGMPSGGGMMPGGMNGGMDNRRSGNNGGGK